MLSFASCGRQHDAEQTVKAFVEANMENGGDDITSRDFADLGTTRHINDSIIQLMRHRGAPRFKKAITYPTAPDGELYYLRMSYVHQGDTLQNTFYLNQDLTEIVAFK
jgi:pyruvate/oxaloacetate carboxyltransferase